MEADAVTFREQFVQCLHTHQPQRLVLAILNVWVVKDNSKPKRLGTQSYGSTK